MTRPAGMNEIWDRLYARAEKEIDESKSSREVEMRMTNILLFNIMYGVSQVQAAAEHILEHLVESKK